MKKIKRPGAGRTKGSFSFVAVPMDTLVKHFSAMPPTFRVMCSRKQMEDFGITGLITGTASDLKESTAGHSEETAPEVKVVEF